MLIFSPLFKSNEKFEKLHVLQFVKDSCCISIASYQIYLIIDKMWLRISKNRLIDSMIRSLYEIYQESEPFDLVRFIELKVNFLAVALASNIAFSLFYLL